MRLKTMHATFIVLFSLLLVGVGFSNTALAGIDFSFHLDKSEAKLSYPIILKVQATWPQNDNSYVFLAPQIHTSGLELTKQGESQETYIHEQSPWVRKTFTFEFAGALPGTAAIDAFEIKYMPKGPDVIEQELLSYYVPKQNVKILSPPLAEKIQPYVIPIAASTGTLLLILMGFKLAINKKNKSLPPKTKSPADDALDQLNQLSQSPKWQIPKDRLYLLASTLRRFLMAHYTLDLHNPSEQQLLDHINGNNHIYDQDIQVILTEIVNAKYNLAGELSKLTIDDLEKKIRHYISGKKVVSQN